eukprot:TRINITY_DN39891_c0_g1_i1.p1 TRINITY_DN39891_c0_g1~~TRINITY_DN39891_c0_g1_i1.p1  ORF type:complete len:164 (-),score=21.46 TRINITY_DN39891_c0_g1_i1:199-690(-)
MVLWLLVAVVLSGIAELGEAHIGSAHQQALSIEYPYFTEERTFLNDDIEAENMAGNTREKPKRNEESSKAGLRLSLSNNIDVLRDKLFTAMASKGPEAQKQILELLPSRKEMLMNSARTRAKERFFVRNSPHPSLAKFRRNAPLNYKWQPASRQYSSKYLTHL